MPINSPKVQSPEGSLPRSLLMIDSTTLVGVCYAMLRPMNQIIVLVCKLDNS